MDGSEEVLLEAAFIVSVCPFIELGMTSCHLLVPSRGDLIVRNLTFVREDVLPLGFASNGDLTIKGRCLYELARLGGRPLTSEEFHQRKFRVRLISGSPTGQRQQ